MCRMRAITLCHTLPCAVFFLPLIWLFASAKAAVYNTLLASMPPSYLHTIALSLCRALSPSISLTHSHTHIHFIRFACVRARSLAANCSCSSDLSQLLLLLTTAAIHSVSRNDGTFSMRKYAYMNILTHASARGAKIIHNYIQCIDDAGHKLRPTILIDIYGCVRTAVINDTVSRILRNL